MTLKRTQTQQEIQVIILAAGLGTRMRPITNLIPKPLIPINDKPFIEYLITNLYHCGIKADHMYVVVKYLREKLIRYLKHLNPAIRTIDQPLLDGTAGGLNVAAQYIDRTQPVLLLMGDNYYSVRDIQSIVSYNNHVIGCVRSDTPQKYGVVETRAEGSFHLVNRIVEKPQHYSFEGYVLISAGIYKFLPSVYPILDQVVASYRKEKPDSEIPITDVITILAGIEPFVAHEVNDWQDMGCPSDLARMKRWILKQSGSIETLDQIESG